MEFKKINLKEDKKREKRDQETDGTNRKKKAR